MTATIIIAIGILGAIVGSFLNVVIFRFHTGRGISGRSHCMSCGKTLSWYELIPLASFLIQSGRCRTCHSKISSQYFAVEFLTGLAFAGVASMYVGGLVYSLWAIAPIIFGCVLVALFIVITVYDMKHLIMPDIFVATFIILAGLQLFIPSLVTGGIYTMQFPSWGHILSGIIIPLPFLLLWFISKGRWIGFGDIKFMVGIGWLLGLTLGITAVIFSFWIGTLWIMIAYGIRYIAKSLSTRRLVPYHIRRIMKREIPFAPFLIIATFIVFVTRFDFIVYLLTH